VIEADCGGAVAGIDANTPACALIDLELGDEDGALVAARLRKESPTLPIAFFSAGASNERLERARAIGPVFKKPSQLDQAVAWLVAHAR